MKAKEEMITKIQTALSNMRCKNCKYFQRYNDSHYGDCKCEKFIYGNEMDIPNKSNADVLLYIDYECYKAFFEVGENFGCIHFKKRSNK